MAKKRKPETTGEDGIRPVARNKRAYYNYEVVENLECGVALVGSEVKSLRNGSVDFVDSYAVVRDDELFLVGMNIAGYAQATYNDHEPARTRRLLVHKRQARKLRHATAEKGLTLVPLRIYFKRGIAKIEIGLVRGKARVDKRETIRDRDVARDRQRTLRNYNR